MNSRIYTAVIVFIFVTLFLYYALLNREYLEYYNLSSHVSYVGNEECSYCHQDIYNSYLRTGMGRSFYKPNDQPEIENFTTGNRVFDNKNNLHYEVSKDGESYFQLEYRENDRGERIHELKREVDFIVGSGNNNRTYLTNVNGYINEMPVTWYSEKSIWDLSPGYENINMRFNRPIVEECMHCHNGYNSFEKFSVNRFTDKIAEGISCERCHGPGQLHVEKHKSPNKASNGDHIDRTIVNPEHLSADLQMDVCRQCHLQGEISVFKSGKSSTDFRPGMQLSSVKTVFIEDQLPKGDFRIASHGGRLSLSACFVESQGAMTCTTCHNPHEPVQDRSRDYFNNQCLNCHHPQRLSKLDSHSIKGDCARCHMKQGATEDILHVNFTDHWIRKNIEVLTDNENRMLRKREKTVKLIDFFDEKDDASDIRKGIAYVHFYENRHSDPSYLIKAGLLLNKGLERLPNHIEGNYNLGRAYQLQGKKMNPIVLYKKVIQLDPNHMWSLYQLGKLYLYDDTQQSLSYFLRAINLNMDNAKVWKEYGDALLLTENIKEAKRAYKRSIKIDPYFATAYNKIGELELYKNSDLQSATMNFLKAIQYNPDHVFAMHNMANIAIIEKDFDMAENYSKRVIAYDPSFSASYGTLATVSMERGKNEEAKVFLHKLISLEPNNQQAASMLKGLNY
jgi:tetratricopeptide (TPR) repeat protein